MIANKATMNKNKRWFVPVTPAGTPVINIAGASRQEAINNLLEAAAHMPYGTWENFQKRGYTIEEWDFDPR